MPPNPLFHSDRKQIPSHPKSLAWQRDADLAAVWDGVEESKSLPQAGPNLAAKLNAAGPRNVSHTTGTSGDEPSRQVGKTAPGPCAKYDVLGVDPPPVVFDACGTRSYGEQEAFSQDTTGTAFIVAKQRTMADALTPRVWQDCKSIHTIILRLRCNNDLDEVTLHQPG